MKDSVKKELCVKDGVCGNGGGGGGGGGAGGGEAEEAGYRIKSKNPTQRCGEKQQKLLCKALRLGTFILG